MKKTALVVMAAGIGSRFGGGIKQLAKLGPSGEIIMDYSVHDALEAGFDKIVFIIRKDIEADFKEIIGNRMEKIADCYYAYQELDAIPEGYSIPEGRKKPWGTAHALLQVRDVIDCPFAVINADDFYGKEGFKLLHDYMVNEMDTESDVFDMCMAGFIVGNTLSDNGTVCRGVCTVNEKGELARVQETYDIERTAAGSIAGKDAEGNPVEVDQEAIVSMNMWGLPPKFLDSLAAGFPAFLDAHGAEVKSEYLLPAEIDKLIQAGKAKVKVLKDHDKWFGVTYAEDKDSVIQSIQALVDEGVYPARLFD